jgi:hypothetical protein
VLHLSPPGPEHQLEITGGPSQGIEVRCRTVPLTHHPRWEHGWQPFRADTTNAVLRRACLSPEVGDNDHLLDLCELFDDLGTGGANIIQLYTTGGRISCVSPEGAQIPMLAKDSLWLGRFMRRSRIQFSPPIAPEAAGAIAVAPRLAELRERLLSDGELVTGLGHVDESIVVLTQRTIYVLAGEVPGLTYEGETLSRAIELPSDAGCVEARSVVSYPGGVLFRGQRCFYRFSRSHGLEPIGERIKLLSDQFPVTTSAVVVPELQEVRFTVTTTTGGQGRILVFDYRNDAWYEWNVLQAGGQATAFAGAVYHRGVYHAIQANGEVFYEDATAYFDDETQFIESDVWTGWVQPAGPGSWHNFTRLDLLGNRDDPCQVTMEIYADYDESAPVETIEWTATQLAELPAAGTRIEISHEPQASLRQAISVRLVDTADNSVSGRGFSIVALGIDVVPFGGAQRTTREAAV